MAKKNTTKMDTMEFEKFEKQMKIRELITELCEAIEYLGTSDEKIETLNYVRAELHSVSPLKHHPVDYVFWAKSDKVEANEYNPNAVAPPEMQLLYESISNDGYTMPIVSFNDEKIIRIVDGFHRR